jgi:class 3 adenylate cyclase
VHAFLFADVRGYTHFTRVQGDEAAAQLVARFTEVVRQEVEKHAGRVLELRGDEVLATFSSVRQGLRAAVAIQAHLAQAHLVEEASAGSVPLIPVGIGLDVGEAVPVGDGYRGGALNLASRLCSAAAAGEVLATPEAVHLAGQLAGLRYLDHRPLKLKGFDEPMQVFRVVAADDKELAGAEPLPSVWAAEDGAGRAPGDRDGV